MGKNKDPRGVYTVVNLQGKKALRISGELFGSLTTIDSLSNYDLFVRWRWGTEQWAPRATGARDSGILFHATGAHGASGKSHNWMDCGDLWGVGGVNMQVPAASFKNDDKAALRFAAKAPKLDVPVGRIDVEPRVHRSANAERPGWNITEVLVRQDSAVFKVNGQVVMSCHKACLREGE